MEEDDRGKNLHVGKVVQRKVRMPSAEKKTTNWSVPSTMSPPESHSVLIKLHGKLQANKRSAISGAEEPKMKKCVLISWFVW